MTVFSIFTPAFALAGSVVGDGSCFGVESIFSCDEGGSIASLLGTGVESSFLESVALGSNVAGFCREGLVLGRELAFVVSLR